MQSLSPRGGFATSWAPLSTNERVDYRCLKRQMKPVSSITRAALLMEVPDEESSKSVSLKQLAKVFGPTIPIDVLEAEVAQLMSDGYLVQSARGSIQKLLTLPDCRCVNSGSSWFYERRLNAG